MATSTQRRDFLGRKLVSPTSASKDFMGRPTTSTADAVGRLLVAPVRANTTAYVKGDIVEFTTGELFICQNGGTSAGAQPGVPNNGGTVSDGGVLWRRDQ
jgi:hypothetical protein